jgi:hypothetical protein
MQSVLILRSIAYAAVSFGVLICCPEAYAGVSCNWVVCGNSNPVYINVYWENGNWDHDVGGVASGITEEQIDVFTGALVHSTYFNKLSQYTVRSVSMLPSMTVTSCGPPPDDVDTAHTMLPTFLSCVKSLNPAIPENAILNVFLPPWVVNLGFCNPDANGAHAAAEHDITGPGGMVYTFMPATKDCTGAGPALLTALSHEMVEAATDPIAGTGVAGWHDWLPPYNEIGDFCDFITPNTTSFLFNSVEQYWSNEDNKCVPGFVSTVPLSITSMTVCGTGKDMEFVLNGDFGALPTNIPLGLSPSIYVTAAISGKASWMALNLGMNPAGTVGLGRIDWSKQQIRISGFDAAYGSSGRIVSPGDTVLITVWNPENGAAVSRSIVAPQPARLVGFPSDLTVNQTVPIHVSVVDNQSCTVDAGLISWTASAGSFQFPTATMDTTGMYSGVYTDRDTAGRVSVGVSGPTNLASSVNVHPVMGSLVQPRGTTAGGQITTLTGQGFTSSTAVMFGTNAGVLKSVSPDHTSVQVTTPPAMPVGSTDEVSVTANVSGIAGYGGPLEYQYLSPEVPFLEFLGGLNGEISNVCNAGRVRVSLFEADGTLESGSINLSANYKAFQAGPVVRRSSVTVNSGSTVVVYDAGPITAINPNVPSAPVTQTFPIMSASLCKALSTFQARLSQLAARVPALHSVVAPCSGDCEPIKNTVIWIDSEKTPGGNMVSVQGKNADTIAERYRIDSVSIESMRRLIAANPFAIFAKEGSSAEFLGPAVQIERAKINSRKTDERFNDTCRISFTVPAFSSLSGTYTIMHLRSVGGRQAWIADNPASTDHNGRTITTVANSVGTYALVRLSTTATKQRGLK